MENVKLKTAEMAAIEGSGKGMRAPLQRKIRRQAAQILKKVLTGDEQRKSQASIKTLIYAPNIVAKKATLALTCRCLKCELFRLHYYRLSANLSPNVPHFTRFFCVLCTFGSFFHPWRQISTYIWMAGRRNLSSPFTQLLLASFAVSYLEIARVHYGHLWIVCSSFNHFWREWIQCISASFVWLPFCAGWMHDRPCSN